MKINQKLLFILVAISVSMQLLGLTFRTVYNSTGLYLITNDLAVVVPQFVNCYYTMAVFSALELGFIIGQMVTIVVTQCFIINVL